MRPNWLFMAYNSITASWRTARRTGSCLTSSMCSSSTRYSWHSFDVLLHIQVKLLCFPQEHWHFRNAAPSPSHLYLTKIWKCVGLRRFLWFLTGGDLCEVSESLRCSVPAAGGAELSCYCNPQGYGTGGEVGAASLLKQSFFEFVTNSVNVLWLLGVQSFVLGMKAYR